MTEHTVLILEEDKDTREAITARLKAEGIATVVSNDAGTLHDQIGRHAVDICLIGTRLPGGDGLHVVRDLRQNTSSGLIAIGHSGDEVDVVLALEMGADDYLVRPVRLREMCARVRSVMRRTLAMRAVNGDPRPLPDAYLRKLGDLEICAIARSVTMAGQPVDLTAMEFDVLCVLAARTNSVLSRDRIIESIRGSHWSVNHRAVDGIVSRLRRKLFADESGKLWIKTVHGRGYMLVEQA